MEPALVRLRGAASVERRWVSAYCLAYAGGSTAAFSELSRAAPEWMEVVGVEMPGKGELADAKWPADAEEAKAAAAATRAGGGAGGGAQAAAAAAAAAAPSLSLAGKR